MRRYGWFQGFKKGNGMFSQFVFTTPDICAGEINKEDETDTSFKVQNDKNTYSKRIGPDGKPLGLSGGGQ